MKIFVLEDDIRRIKILENELRYSFTDLVITSDVEEAKKEYEDFESFDVYFLDHDLGGEIYVDSNNPNTGFQFAKYLADKITNNPIIIIHSLNPDGRSKMYEVLNKFEVILAPFGSKVFFSALDYIKNELIAKEEKNT